ncbi:MAG: TetR/AcrR family transcriptional regulator [Acidobacteriota bacterium]|nr:TetR/AcrR family transcriptional regulator [Acidobacteriota bacterium]
MPRTGLTSKEIKEKAINAALERMREVGFEKVRLTEIAKELEVSHAALYSHFKDKSALLDAVSERWLLELDEKLKLICRKNTDPCQRIHAWALEIHRMKVKKVKNDPELYKSFNLATEQLKPFVQDHLEIMHRQLSGLVEEAIAKSGLKNQDTDKMTKIIVESLVAFNHPTMVLQFVDENREKMLYQVLDTILKGFGLKI